jgi:hypothetical protein
MSSIHPISPHLCFYQIFFILFIIIKTETSPAQMPHSSGNPKQDTSRIDRGSHHMLEEQLVLPSFSLQINNGFNKNSNLKGSMSIVLILENYTELRNAGLKEYIRQQLSNETDINVARKLNINLVGNPILENELRRKLQRYGVPYDPLRPTVWQIGYTFYFKDVISCLEKILNYVLNGNSN